MNKALSGFSDQDLRQELVDRENDRKAKAVEKNKKWLGKLTHVITMDVIDMLAPEHREITDPHSPPNCSDESPYLGFGTSRAGDPPGCTRCGLMEMMKGTASENVMNNLIEVEFSLKVTSP
jgi:hypothetical protein